MFCSMITLDMYKSLANLLGAEVWIEYPVKDILVYDAAAGPVRRRASIPCRLLSPAQTT